MCSSNAIVSGHSLTSARWSRNTRSASANAEMLLNLPQVTCRPHASCSLTIPAVTALLPLWHDDPYEERAPLDCRLRDRRARDRRRHRGALVRVAPGRARGGLRRRGGAHGGERRERPQRRLPRRGRGAHPPGRGARVRARRRARHLPAPRWPRSSGSTRSPTRSARAAHFAHVGCLRVTWEPDELEHARGQYEAMRADGLPAEWVDEADLPAIVRRPGRVGVFSPARRDHAPGALGAGLLACHRGARRAHLRAQPGLRAARRGAQRRLRRARRERGGARAARRGRGGRRAAAARAVLRADACARSACTWSRRRRSPSAWCPARSAPAGATSTSSSGPTAASPSAASRTATARAPPTPTRRASSRRPRSTPASSASCATTSASRRR